MTSEEWADARLETTYENARAVLEAQREAVSEIDEKAMGTVRITTILLGVLASTFRIPAVGLDPAWAAFGIASLTCSLVLGVLTYGDSELYLGPNREYVRQLAREKFDDVPWHRDLLDSYAYWIAENRTAVNSDARTLLYTQSFLVLGIVATIGGLAF